MSGIAPGKAIVFATVWQPRMGDDMVMAQWPKHFHALDISRGVAALAVVLWHWQHFAYEGISLPRDFERGSQPLYEVFRIFYDKGLLGVQYFFILSGFIFFWAYSEGIRKGEVGVWAFFVSRFSRLYPLHIVTLVLVAILQYFYHTREGGPFVYPFNDTFHFLLNLGFAAKWGFEKGWSFNAPVWSVSIEALLYAIFFVAARLRLVGWVYCSNVSVIAFVLSRVLKQPLFEGMAMFFLGGIVYHVASAVSGRYRWLITPTYLLTLSSWLGTLSSFYIYDIGRIFQQCGPVGKVLLVGWPLYILFPLTVLCLVLIERRETKLRALSWVGDLTYSSYLLHFPVNITFGLAISAGILDRSFYTRPVWLALYFGILIPLSYACFLYFERPAQKFIRSKLLAQHKAVRGLGHLVNSCTCVVPTELPTGALGPQNGCVRRSSKVSAPVRAG